MINIAIVDDGINDQCFYINSIKEHIVVDNDIIVRNASLNNDKYSHGSVCAAILTSKTDVFSITSISMKYDKAIGGYYINSLITSLKLCLILDIDIVHLSLGTMDSSYYYDILEIINELQKKGIIVVAAIDLSERITIPACYSNVLGVMYSPFVKNQEGFRFISNSISGIDVLVNVNERIKMKDGTVTTFDKASSYAVPVICSEIAELLTKMKRLYTIKAKYGVTREKNIDWIDNPLIVIFSREKNKIIIGEFVIYNTYNVINFTLENINIDVSKIVEEYKKVQDIIIVDDFDDEKSMFRFYKKIGDFLSDKNIALLSDNLNLTKYVMSITKGRLYLSTDITSKKLIQNVPNNNDIQIFEEVYKDEGELKNIILRHTDFLYISFEKIHMIYGIDYVPVEIQRSHKLLQKYISNLSYIYGKNQICIIKKK